MSGARDDEPDGDRDPVVDSMRAVWLSMRDEDPPTAGLSGLLAAARDKAEAMRPRESWWQRTLATLRRPPVLALASVVILVGGGLVVVGQRDQLASEVTAPAQDTAIQGAPSAPSAAPASEPAPAPAPAATAPAAPDPATAPAEEAPSKSAATPPPKSVLPRATTGKRPAGKPTKVLARDTEGESLGGAQRGDEAAPIGGAVDTTAAPPPAPPPPPPPVQNKASPPRRAPQRPVSPPADSDDRSSAREEESRGQGAKDDTAAPGGADPAAAIQAAAARGDCAAVRTGLARLRTGDPARAQQLAQAPAIRRCLVAE